MRENLRNNRKKDSRNDNTHRNKCIFNIYLCICKLNYVMKSSIVVIVSILLYACGSDTIPQEQGKNQKFNTVSFSHDIFDLKKELKVTMTEGSETSSVDIKKKDSYFKIKVKNKATLLSKKKFNLFIIKDSSQFQNFAQLAVAQSVYKNQNLIGLASEFLNVEVEGTFHEMYFQEGFDKRIIESNNNREGVIFTYNKSVEIQYNPTDKEDEILSNEIKSRIEDFVNGNSSSECLIDVRKTGKFVGLLKDLGINKIEQTSLGYYLNPVSNLIEPFIFFDLEKQADQLADKIASDSIISKFKGNSKEEITKIQQVIADHQFAKYASNCNFSEKTLTVDKIKSCYPTKSFNEFFVQKGEYFILKQQEITISSPLIIPSGLDIKFNSGDHIDIVNGGFILSFSAVQMEGTAKNPIKIISSDTLGGGFHVINANSNSNLNYVIFDGLSNLDYQSWKLPSAVTFYESPVIIKNSLFTNNHCEDALNIFRSTPYLFESSVISNTFSDAFDADFSDGIIKNCEIINSGNDGVDISGSNITIINTKFNKIADKALSAGENSSMKVDSCFIDGASLAIVAKDLSKVEISNTVVANSEVVYCAFQKKDEFGSSSIEATNVSFTNFKEENLIEEGSKLKVDGEKIHNYRDDVKKYLYGNEYGKETVK